MQSTSLHQLLGIPENSKLAVVDVQFANWGQVIRFDCAYYPDEAQAHGFSLVFTDCRELKWRVYVHALEGQALIADFRPGRSAHRSPALLLTETFGLSLIYGEMTVEWG